MGPLQAAPASRRDAGGAYSGREPGSCLPGWAWAGPKAEASGDQEPLGHRSTEPLGPSQNSPQIPQTERQEILHMSACIYVHKCVRVLAKLAKKLVHTSVLSASSYMHVHTCTYAVMKWLCSDQLWDLSLRANDLSLSLSTRKVGITKHA